MNELIQELVLLNLIEAVMTVYIVIDFRKYGKLQVLFALLCCLTTIYLYPLIIPIPVLPQILAMIVNAYILSQIFDLSFKHCLNRSIVFFIIVMMTIETLGFVVYKFLFNINVMTMTNVFDKFLIGVPVRLIEFCAIYNLKRDNIIDEYFNIERLWNDMKFWYFGQVKKSEKKETTEKK